MCPRYADRQVRQFVYGRDWESASNAINTQIDQMKQSIETLRHYRRFLINLRK